MPFSPFKLLFALASFSLYYFLKMDIKEKSRIQQKGNNPLLASDKTVPSESNFVYGFLLSVQKILNLPFPFLNQNRDKFFVSVAFGLFIFCFLLLFQPFGIAQIQFYKTLFVLGYGGITFFIMLLSFHIYPILNTRLDREIWTVKKMFVFILFQFLLIAICNWSYTVSLGRAIINQQHSLVKFVFLTFSVGIIPTLFLIFLIERILSHQKGIIATNLTDSLSKKTKIPQKQIIIIGEQKQKLLLELSELICVKAEGNYVEIYRVVNDGVQKYLVRCALKDIKEQLKKFVQIKQCHRSYVINTHHLKKITGNSRNYNLHFNYLYFKIPVSRNYPIEEITID